VFDHGFRDLPIEGSILRKLKSLGYRPGVVPHGQFKSLAADVPTIDFSSWPMVVRADMKNDIAYALCEAIELRRAAIPTDKTSGRSISPTSSPTAPKRPTTFPSIPERETFTERGII